MPRCGQISRRAASRPCESRQISSGKPKSTWALIFPGRTAVANIAGYQKPRSGALGAGRVLLSASVDMRVWVSSVKQVEDTGITWKGQGTWGYLGCPVNARRGAVKHLIGHPCFCKVRRL